MMTVLTIAGSSLGLLVCFYLLAVVCEEYFVDSLEKIAHKLKLSEDVAGATLMAMGSSAPELFTAIIALTRVGSENVGAGTIVGSAIFNILVIVGASAVVATAYLSWKPVFRDLIFYIVSILVLLFTFRDGRIDIVEASVYVAGYAIYILFLSQWSRWVPGGKQSRDPKEAADESFESPIPQIPVLTPINRLVGLIFPSKDHFVVVFFISIVLIGALSWCLVELAVDLAHAIGISEVIIALTVLAAGTSVPDMLSSVVVAKKGKGDMAVSNAVGSNTFDILVGLGLPWFLYILILGKPVTVSTENLYSSILLLFFTVVALLFLLMVRQFKIGRRSGLLLVGLYIAYLGYAIFAAYNPDPLGIEAYINGAGNATNQKKVDS